LILAVPNFSSLESRRFKEHWFHLDIPWHKYHFNEKSLRYLMTTNDFKIVRISTICLEQGPYGLLQSILNAMGWRKNELYEAMKGNLKPGRGIYVVFQALLVALLLISGSLVSLLTSIREGPVLKAVVQRGN